MRCLFYSPLTEQQLSAEDTIITFTLWDPDYLGVVQNYMCECYITFQEIRAAQGQQIHLNLIRPPTQRKYLKDKLQINTAYPTLTSPALIFLCLCLCLNPHYLFLTEPDCVTLIKSRTDKYSTKFMRLLKIRTGDSNFLDATLNLNRNLGKSMKSLLINKSE